MTTRTLRNALIAGFLFISTVLPTSTSQAHSVQVAYCANCASTLRIFFEHWHGCTVNPATSGTITISMTIGATTTTTTGFPTLNLCNVPFSALPGCNLPPVFVASCPASANVYQDWWAFDFNNVPCGVPISIVASNPSNVYVADCGGMFPVSFSLTIPCNVNKPFANFSVSADTVCLGQAISFTDLSTGGNPGLTYQWDFNDGSPLSTAQNPTHTYAAPGTYCVRLDVAKQSGGCLDDTTICVTVLANPIINIGNPTICAGQTASLTANAAPGGGTYNWTPGGMTTQTINVSPAATTTYTVNYVSPGGCAGSQTATVTVNPQPNVTVGNATICAGQNATLTANTNPGTWTYSWTPGGMTTQTINVSPGTTTNYTVIVTGAGGCADTATGTVTVNPQPTVNVTGGTTVCAGTNVTLSANTNVGPWTYAWTPGGATTQNITVAPGATTTYTVTVTGPGGCNATANATINVNPQPNVTMPNASICTGQSATMTPNVTPPGAWTYQWTPGGATTPTITVSPGATTNYTVIVTGAGGCADTATATLTVTTNPTVNVPNDTVCAGQQGTITALPSVGGGTYLWNPGGNTTQSISATPPATTTYSVTYNNNGCIGTGSGTIVVNPQPTVNVNNATICAGQNATLTANAAPAGVTYAWAPGGATTQSITVSPAATTVYTVTVTAPGGCQATANGTVTVNPQPTAQADSTSICAGQVATLNCTATPGGVTYAWAPGGMTTASINVTPATTQAYTVTVTAPGGCTATSTGLVTVINNPTAAFTAPNVCDGLTMSFTDNSTPVPGGWSWDFGDGIGTSTQQNPTYTYAGPGTYNVKLVITAGSGCVDSVTQAVTVDPLPQPNFTFTDDCANQAINFNNTSTIATGNINGWLWKFGNGATSTQQNPTYTYTAPGAYTVTLVATSDNGCIDSIQQVINIFALPVTDFTFDTVCDGDQTCFIDLTTVQGSNITAWQWVFGDGSPVNNQSNPCHTYANAGTFTVTVITTSAQGCTGTATHTVTVNDNPVANFAVNNVCQVDAAQFTDLSTIGTGVITGWQWDFGDGSPNSTQQNPSHNYAPPLPAGTYTVQLIAFAGTGCSDTITDDVVIHPMPTANFNFTNVCDQLQMPFTDNSNVATGAIINWNWNFGDGSPNGTNQNENHTYPNAQSWNVQLIVTTDSGCTDTISKTVDVYPNPVVDFSPTSVCEGTPSQFMDQTTVPGGNAQTWIWDFGDNSQPQAGQNPTHTYPQWGAYTTKLIVSTNNGCVDSVLKPVNVNAVPVSEFVADVLDGCEPVCPNFTNQATIANGNIVSYVWDFGDGNGSTQTDPSHCYPNSGTTVLTYDVTLTVTSDSGCVHAITKPAYISVYPYPVADFNPDPDIVKISNPEINFNNYSVGNAQNSWDFGDGVGTSTGVSPSYTYQDTGNFIVWLYIENQWGCRDSTWRQVRVDPEFFIYIPNAFTPGEDGINDKWNAVVYGVDEMSTLIFNRWGELIWEGHQLDSKWDGMVKGNKAETETYVYLIKLVTFSGENKEYRGKVTLLK